jgi:hypothetical protein
VIRRFCQSIVTPAPGKKNAGPGSCATPAKRCV